MCAMWEGVSTMTDAGRMKCCPQQKERTKFRVKSHCLRGALIGAALPSGETCFHVNRCCHTAAGPSAYLRGEELGAGVARPRDALQMKLSQNNSFSFESDTNFMEDPSVQRSCDHRPQNCPACHLVDYNLSCTKLALLRRVETPEVFCPVEALKIFTNTFSHITPPLHNYLMNVQRKRLSVSVQSARDPGSGVRSVNSSRRSVHEEHSNLHSLNVLESLLSYLQENWHCIAECSKIVNSTNDRFYFIFFHLMSTPSNVANFLSAASAILAVKSISFPSISYNSNLCLGCSCDLAVSSVPSRSKSSSDLESDKPSFHQSSVLSSVDENESSSVASFPARETMPSFAATEVTREKPLSSPNFYPTRKVNPQLATGSHVTASADRGVPSSGGRAISPREANDRKSRRSVRRWFSLRTSVEMPRRLVAVVLLLLCPILAAASAIKEPPRLTVPYAFEMLTVPRSDDRSLLCPIIGTPTPIFEWYKDGESIPDDAGWDRITVSESRLRIKDAQLEDSGRYVCTAVNGFGKLNYTFVITINDPLAPPSLHEDQGAPTLLQVYPQSPGPPIIKMAGQSVSLKCRVGGVPEPVVVWYKDGVPLSTDGSPALSRSNDLHALHIGRLHHSDAGLYTCTATNLFGPVTANWTLRVLGSSSGVSSSPALTPPPLRVHNASVIEGEREAVLTCDGASGSGEPRVKWLRARGSSSSGFGGSVGDPFVDWKGRQFAVLQPSSVVMKLPGVFVTKLVIEYPKHEHAGEYVCMATTTDGTAVGTASLTVMPRGPGSILLVVMGLLGSIAVIAVVTAVVATYRRRRRQQRHVGAFKPTPAAGGYKGHPSSQASSNLLQADDCQRQPGGKNGMAGSVNGGPYPPRCVRPPGVQGRVGDSGALLPHQEGMVARYQDPSSASVYLSGQQGLNDSSGGSDYKPPLTPLNDFQQQQQYQQIAAPQQFHLPSQQQQQQHQYQVPQQQHLLTSPQQCGLQQHPNPQQQQYQASIQQQQQIPPQQFQYHQLDVI